MMDTASRDELRTLLAAAPDGPPWIRRWESLDVHGMRGDGVLADQRNIDLIVAAVNALPALLADTPSVEPHSADLMEASGGEPERYLAMAAEVEAASLDVYLEIRNTIGFLRSVIRSGETLNAEDEARVDAALDALRPSVEPAGLREAWRAVEAALPDGWLTLTLSKRAKSDIGPYSAAVHDGSEGAMAIRTGLAVGHGSTPEIALQRLAARLLPTQASDSPEKP